MTSENSPRLVVPAPANTPCGWWAYGETGHKHTCGSGLPAVHVLTATLPVAEAGTALCGFHSPYDVTEADRAATNGTEAEVSGVEILAKVYADRIAHVKATETVGPEMPLATWEQEVSGVEILADMLTLEPVAEVPVFDVVKFHKMSAPMVSVALAVAAMRGRVDAWHMNNVILPTSTKATKATVKALIRRGILAEVIGDNDGTPSSLMFYVLTDTGCDLVAVLGCPIAFLPTDTAEADTYVRRAGVRPGDCSDGCDNITARSLPLGGTVCLGCGSTFTRAGEDTHPGTLAVSEAVIRRNTLPSVGDVIVYSRGPWASAVVKGIDGDTYTVELSNLSVYRPVAGVLTSAEITSAVMSGKAEIRKGN